MPSNRPGAEFRHQKYCTDPAAEPLQFLSIVTTSPHHPAANAGIVRRVKFRLVLHRGRHDEIYRRRAFRDHGDDRACSCIVLDAEFYGGVRTSGCLTCFGGLHRPTSTQCLIGVRHVLKTPVLESINSELSGNAAEKRAVQS
jgi:hypothetical protein